MNGKGREEGKDVGEANSQERAGHASESKTMSIEAGGDVE